MCLREELLYPSLFYLLSIYIILCRVRETRAILGAKIAYLKNTDTF